MTLDQIIKDFRDAVSPPAEALRAAVPLTDALAPIVFARQEQACRGICLMPGDDNLLFYGLHVLAAAKHPDLWPRLIELLRQPEEELAMLFADRTSSTMAALMLSVWNGDIDAVFLLIEHADMCDDSKWALFDVVARLTFDGRIPRRATIEFLERFERDGLADDDSHVWWGWESCVAKLGVADLRPALDRVRAKPAYSGLTPEDMADTQQDLEHSAGGAGNAEAFDKEGICAISDPVTALQWLVIRDQTMRQWNSEAPPPPAHVANDPAHQARLTDAQRFWLDRFLESRQVPATTMPLPMLDGFLTALVIGPTVVPPHDYLPVVWGDGENKAEPQWSDAAQSTHVLGLIARIHGAILTRCNAGAEHVPLIQERYGTLADARVWAEGFITGIDFSGTAWEPVFADRRGCEDVLAVLAMADDNAEYFGRPATSDEVLQIADRLPRILQRIATYWRDPARAYPKTQPVRAAKIGRNDPCPCGSGKKYKKCCALKELS